MAMTTVRYRGAILHLYGDHFTAAPVDHCSAQNTHTPVFISADDFTQAVERDPVAIGELRGLFMRVSNEPGLSLWTDEQVLRQTAVLLARGRIRAVECEARARLRFMTVPVAKRRFHVMSGPGAGSINCRYHSSHRVIQPSGAKAEELAGILVGNLNTKAELMRMARISGGANVAANITKLLETGRLTVVECVPMPVGVGARSQASDQALVATVPLREGPPRARDGLERLTLTKTWIEIRLVDEDDKPVPNEPYWLKLPDGSERRGTLDADGFARINDVDPGTCMVSFQEIDQREWRPA